MGDAGVEHFVEIAVLDEDIVALFPEFHPVAEADSQVPVPHRSADEAEGAPPDNHVMGAAGHGMNAASEESQIFRDGIGHVV